MPGASHRRILEKSKERDSKTKRYKDKCKLTGLPGFRILPFGGSEAYGTVGTCLKSYDWSPANVGLESRLFIFILQSSVFFKGNEYEDSSPAISVHPSCIFILDLCPTLGA